MQTPTLALIRDRLAGLSRSSAGFNEATGTALTQLDTIAAWLGECYSASRSTGDTYLSSMALYVPWCDDAGVLPLTVTREDASRFAHWLATSPSDRTGQLRGDSRYNQVLAACTSLLEYAADAGRRPEGLNPFARIRRRPIDQHHTTARVLDVSQVNQLVLAAREDGTFHGVLGKLLVAIPARMGLRPGDMCRLDVGDVRDDGHGGYELRVTVKGGKKLTRWLPPDVASDLYTYLQRGRVEPEDEGDQALFVSPLRRGRVQPWEVLSLVKRASTRAGLAHGVRLRTRDLRHTFGTITAALGVSLDDRQHGLGHASAETTKRYDRTVWTRHRDPAISLSAAFGEYPAEDRIAPLERSARGVRPVQAGCDCTPQWPELHVDLSPIGVDETAIAVPAETPEPGTHRLAPYCRRCRTAYPGFFRTTRVLDDREGVLLDQARRALVESALYPAAVDRRAERRRLDGS